MGKILKVLVPGIALFVIYLCLWKVAESYFYRGDYNDYLFCIGMSAIVTPIYYFVCMKHLGVDLDRGTYYIIQTVIFSNAVVLYSFLWPVEDYGFFQGLECIVRIMRYSLMYLIGSAIYALICYVVCGIRKAMYVDILRRLAAAVLLFVVYSFLSEGILPNIIGIFVLVASTGICHIVSKGILRVSYEKIFDYIFELSILICGKLLRYIIFDLDFYDELLIGIIRISILYAFGNGIYFMIEIMWKSVKKEKNGRVDDYQQASEVLLPNRAEGKDITEGDGLHNGFASYKQYDLPKAVLESIKFFLSGFEDEFFPVDDEYHLQAGKNVCHPDLLFYNMKLQCLVAVDLKIDDFKPEYSDRMYNYLDALDRDVKKPHENPSVGIILCKNEDTGVVEYCLNKSLSQEMAAEYETELIDKKILKEKLGELYDMMKEPNLGVNT